MNEINKNKLISDKNMILYWKVISFWFFLSVVIFYVNERIGVDLKLFFPVIDSYFYFIDDFSNLFNFYYGSYAQWLFFSLTFPFVLFFLLLKSDEEFKNISNYKSQAFFCALLIFVVWFLLKDHSIENPFGLFGNFFNLSATNPLFAFIVFKVVVLCCFVNGLFVKSFFIKFNSNLGGTHG